MEPTANAGTAYKGLLAGWHQSLNVEEHIRIKIAIHSQNLVKDSVIYRHI